MQSDAGSNAARRLDYSPTIPGAFRVSPSMTASSPTDSLLFDEPPADPDNFYRNYGPGPLSPNTITAFATMPATTRIPRTVNSNAPRHAPNGAPASSPMQLRIPSSRTSSSDPLVDGTTLRPDSISKSRVVRVGSNASIKERIAALEKQSATTSASGHSEARKHNRSRVPLASNGSGEKGSGEETGLPVTTKPDTFYKQWPSPQIPRKVQSKPAPASHMYLSPISPQQPLFGDIPHVTEGSLGHGTRLNAAKRRSASESNIQLPSDNTRCQSTSDARQSQSFDATRTPRTPYSRHRESATSPTLFKSSTPSLVNDRSSTFQLPAATFGQYSRQRPSKSNTRCPPRYSASAEHLPTHFPRDSKRDLRPKTPVRNRYASIQNRTPSSGHSVNAVIKDVMGKNSTPPALRSSKPRVPVSAASTAASRARIQRRSSGESLRSASPVLKGSASEEQRPRTKGILKAAEEARARSRSRKQRPNYAATDSSVSLTRSNSHDDSAKLHEQELEGDKTPRPDIAVDTAVDAADWELSKGLTEPDDESPTLGRDAYQPPGAGQSHDRMPDEDPFLSAGTHALSPIMASPDPSQFSNEPSPTLEQQTGPGAEPDSGASEGSLLGLAMRIREGKYDSGVGTSRVTNLFGGADEGTINVAFRDTPVLEGTERGWSQTNAPMLQFTTPNPDELSDSALENTHRSINVDDSVSAILGPRSSQGGTPTTFISHTPIQPSTLDSTARLEISKLLEYYNSHLISPQEKREFQERIGSVLPALKQDEEAWSEAWAEPRATRHFLKTVLDKDDEARRRGDKPSELASVPRSVLDDPVAGSQPESAGSCGSVRYPCQTTPESYHSPGTALVHLEPQSPDKDSPEQFYSSTSATFIQPQSTHKERSNGSVSVSGLDIASNFQPQHPEAGGTGLGLGLGLGTSSDQAASSYSMHPTPIAPLHAPPLPPPPPVPPCAPPVLGYLLPLPPSLPMSPGYYLDASLVSQKYPMQRSPEAMRGKRKPVRSNRDSDSSVNTARLSIGAVSQLSAGEHRRSYSATTLADSGSVRQSLDPERTVAESTVTTTSDKSITDASKRLNMRRLAIKELVDTEYVHNQDMVILEDIYKGTATPILTHADLKVVFGNLDQVRLVSTKFLDAVKRAGAPVYSLPKSQRWIMRQGSFSTRHSGAVETVEPSFQDRPEEERAALDRETTIGHVFREHAAELARIYGDFLKNQSSSRVRLLELQRETAVKTWLEECSESAKDLTGAWDIDSMLVKPMQRLSKYPLLIENLRKYTPKDHPDYKSLELANEDMRRALSKINDRNRREDILQQVLRGTAASKDKEKKFKLLKSKGNSNKMQHYVGTVNMTEDREYDAVAQKFGGHFFQLQIVMRDIEKYCDDVVVYVNWYVHFITTLGDFLDLKPLDHSDANLVQTESKWIAFGQAVKAIAISGLERHTREVRNHVIEPIVQLWKLHEQPQKMMLKRKTRLTDYAKCRETMEKNMKPEKKLQEASEQFEAINETLKEELPKLYALTRSLVEGCLFQFVKLQAAWQQSWIRNISRIDRALEKQEDIESVLHDFREHYDYVRHMTGQFSIVNGTGRERVNQLASPASGAGADDAFSHKRPSTRSSRSTIAVNGHGHGHGHNLLGSPDSFTGGHHQRLSGSHLGASPLSAGFPTPAEQYQAGRTRAASGVSLPSPSTPMSNTVFGTAHPARPATAVGSRANDSITGIEGWYRANSRPRSGTDSLSAEPGCHGSMSSVGHTPPPHGPPPQQQAQGYVSSASFLFPDPAEQQRQRLHDEQAIYQAELNAQVAASAMMHAGQAQVQVANANANGSGRSDFAREFYTNRSPMSKSFPENERREQGRSQVFSSAMPMDDSQTPAAVSVAAAVAAAMVSPVAATTPAANGASDELEVLFLAASLFEFRIDPSRTEAGYSYLRYAPGEVFDVVAIKGELWLARNQDDAERKVGWIWEKHFARILDA